jgi:IclR family transcriptional regulator, pca regulon regulatory protein
VLERLEHCRRDGWAGADGELELGVRSMAVPVFNREGSSAGGLSISVRAERMTMREFRDTLLPVLLKAQEKLRENLYRD